MLEGIKKLFGVKKGVSTLDSDFWDGGASASKSGNVTQQPFRYHPWVYSATRAVQFNVARVPKVMVDSKGRTYQDHPVLKLLQNPNQMLTQHSFFRAIIAYLMLPTQGKKDGGGQCFIVPWNKLSNSKVRLDKGEMPDELIPFSDQYFTAITEGKGLSKFSGWRMEIASQSFRMDFAPNEIIRINMLDPYDLLKGMPSFGPVMGIVESDAKADYLNERLLDSDGRLAGALTTDQPITPEQASRYRTDWRQTYGGAGNAYKVAVLGNGLKYEQYGLALAEMQWVEQKKWAKDAIIGAAGVNKIAVGDYESINFATIQEGRKMLWYDTYMPMDELILDALNTQWVRYIDNGMYILKSDYSKIYALRADIHKNATTAALLVTALKYPSALASRIMDIPLTTEDLEKYPHLLDPPAPEFPTMDAVPESTTSAESEKATTKILRSAKADKKPRTIEQLRLINALYVQKVLAPAERKFKAALEQYFIKQRNKILDKIDAWADNNKALSVIKADTVHPLNFLPDVSLETEELMKLHRASSKAQMQLEKKQLIDELGGLLVWDINEPLIDKFVNARKIYMRTVNSNTFNVAGDAISASVQQAIDDGLTQQQLVRNMKDAVQDVYKARLGQPTDDVMDEIDLSGIGNYQTIARTEMGSIASATRHDAFVDEGVEYVQWSTATDEIVRKSHQDLEGKTTKLDTKFPGTDLRYPRDQECNDLGEIINCRCVALALTKEEAEAEEKGE